MVLLTASAVFDENSKKELSNNSLIWLVPIHIWNLIQAGLMQSGESFRNRFPMVKRGAIK
jgi:hypothetical protein